MKHKCRLCDKELPEFLQPMAEAGTMVLCGYSRCETTGATDGHVPRCELPPTQSPPVPDKLCAGCVIELLDVDRMCMGYARNGETAIVGQTTDPNGVVDWPITPVIESSNWSQYWVSSDWVCYGYFRIVEGPK